MLSNLLTKEVNRKTKFKLQIYLNLLATVKMMWGLGTFSAVLIK